MSKQDSAALVVVGGANYDYLAKGKKLPGPGTTEQGDVIDDAPGGKGANQAIGAARLGARVSFVGRIGADERGDRVISSLQREHVDTTYLVRDPEAPTGVALIHVDASGEKQILAILGANSRMTVDDLQAARALITSAKVLLLQLEVPLEVVRSAAVLAHNAGVKVVLDPAPAIPLQDELLRLVDVIKPNSAEAGVITGITVTDRDSAARASAQLIERGVGGVSIAAGEGTLVTWRGGESWLPRLPVKSVDATGAGDSFAAALGVALMEGKPLPEAAAFANAAAALATTVIGAQAGMPSRDAVLRRLQGGNTAASGKA